MSKAVYSVGRFQPPTIGHAAMIDTLKDLAKSTGAIAFVFVSSSQGTGKEKIKNPLTSSEKVPFLQKMFPEGVTFVDTAKCDPRCGGPLAAYKYLLDRGFTDITLVAGSDREAEFGPSGRLWDTEPPKFYAVKRDEVTGMSGTKARALAVSGDYVGFSKAVTRGNVSDSDVRKIYDTLRSRLLNTKRGGKNENVRSKRKSRYGRRAVRRTVRRIVGSRRTRSSCY